MSQFFDSLITPTMNPRIVAKAIPSTATRRVFKIPTNMARRWVEEDEYSMSVCEIA